MGKRENEGIAGSQEVLGAPALALKAAKFMRSTGLLGQFYPFHRHHNHRLYTGNHPGYSELNPD